jgi:S1-C subfamily serine protease
VDGFLQYQVSCPISPGNSGSPILNNRGEVIGIASWTKVDAQNVSFAIPTRELSRLNVSGQPTPWEQLAATARPALPARSINAHQTTGSRSEGAAVGGDFAAFQKLLNDSVGKSMTVVVQTEERTNTFAFTVE